MSHIKPQWPGGNEFWYHNSDAHLLKAILTQMLTSRMLSDSVPPLSVRRSICQSVRWSVTLYFFGVLAVFGLTALAQMMK